MHHTFWLHCMCARLCNAVPLEITVFVIIRPGSAPASVRQYNCIFHCTSKCHLHYTFTASIYKLCEIAAWGGICLLQAYYVLLYGRGQLTPIQCASNNVVRHSSGFYFIVVTGRRLASLTMGTTRNGRSLRLKHLTVITPPARSMYYMLMSSSVHDMFMIPERFYLISELAPL